MWAKNGATYVKGLSKRRSSGRLARGIVATCLLLHRFIGQSIGPSVADQYMQHLGHIQHVRQVENTIVVIERVDIDGCRSPIVQPNGLASTLQIEALLHHACRFLTGTASIMTFPPAYVRHPLHTTTYRRHSTALRHLPPGI